MAVQSQEQRLGSLINTIEPASESSGDTTQSIDVAENPDANKRNLAPSIINAAGGGSLTNLALDFIENSSLTERQKMLFRSLAVGAQGDDAATGRFIGNMVAQKFGSSGGSK